MKGELKGSWLDDDPEWKALRQRISNKRPSRKETARNGAVPANQKPSSDTKNIKVSFNVSIPKVKLPKLPTLTSRQIRIGVIAIVAILTVFGTVKLTNHSNKSDNGASGVLGGNVQEPDFDTILPDGKKGETESGKVGYDPVKKVASFTDTINNVPITVSQQPLPEVFKDNADEELRKLAEGFSANEVIMEANPKAYIGSSTKGPQTVVFYKNGVLVFIQSASKIDKSDWAGYITGLY